MANNIADAEESDAKMLASITDADTLEQFLVDHWGEQVLDDDVHDAKSAEASQINNDGMGAQIAYLAGSADVSALARTLAERLYDYSPGDLPDADVVLVLTIDHHHGFEVSVHRSHESVTKDLIAWVDQSWSTNGPPGEMPDDIRTAVKAYFDFTDETYHISPTEITPTDTDGWEN
jgi:hypothetical protein